LIADGNVKKIMNFDVLERNKEMPITDFWLSQWSIIDINSVLWLLQRVNVGNFADISEAHAAAIFNIEVWISEFLCV
jgi:uncharacterized paraquat-inducible protein A